MISKDLSKICKDDIKNIKGYEEAVKSPNMYICHHVLECEDTEGRPRLVDLSSKELIALDMYYDQDAKMLKFMSMKDHRKVHIKSSCKGKRIWNNGKEEVYAKECPGPKYKRGRLSWEYKIKRIKDNKVNI